MGTKPTKLQAAAADEKKQKKGLGLLASALAILGLAPATAGKMRKVTETHKHVKLEEEDGGGSESTGSEEEESEEEEEEGDGSSASSGGSEASTDSSKSEEEEEEEEEEGSMPPKKKGAGKSEEEEEKALARAVGAALNSPTVHASFLAALPTRHRDAGAIFSPHRLASLSKKATGTRTTYGAMMGLADLKKGTRATDEAVLSRQAKIEKRVARVEGANRKARVDAIVDVAKSKGVAGATTRDGRAMLREYGMTHGTTKLTAFLGAQPTVVAKPKMPRGDGSTGAPSPTDQMAAIRKAATAGITDPKEAAAVLKDFDERIANLNGAGAGTET